MADEITVFTGITVSKGDLSFRQDVASFQSDMAGDKLYSAVQEVGTTYEAVAKGDVGTIGWAVFQNLDATNFVQFGKEIAGPAFEPFCKVLPGEKVCVYIGLTAIHAKADTAAVDCHITLIEA